MSSQTTGDAGTSARGKDGSRGQHRRYLQQMLPVISFVLASSGVLITFFVFKTDSVWRIGEGTFYRSSETDRMFASMRVDVARAREESALSKKLVEGLAQAKPANVETARLATQVAELQSEVSELREAIGQSPEKALAIPMLRKDVENFREGYRRDLEATQSEINRVYDQNKWFLGLVATMALAMISLAVSNFLLLRRA